MLILTCHSSQYAAPNITQALMFSVLTFSPTDSPFGLSLAVNGNLVNSEELRSFLDLEARRHVNTDSDSELLYANSLPGRSFLGIC